MATEGLHSINKNKESDIETSSAKFQTDNIFETINTDIAIDETSNIIEEDVKNDDTLNNTRIVGFINDIENFNEDPLEEKITSLPVGTCFAKCTLSPLLS